jgi:hypothetical protein
LSLLWLLAEAVAAKSKVVVAALVGIEPAHKT